MTDVMSSDDDDECNQCMMMTTEYCTDYQMLNEDFGSLRTTRRRVGGTIWGTGTVLSFDEIDHSYTQPQGIA
jgi:hypothetical protein